MLVFMRPLLVMLVLISFLVPVSAGPCGGVINCACGDTITNYYTMVSDLNCSTGLTAISIGSDDVVLDCAGYFIIGDNNPVSNEIGILNKGYDNVTIKNCGFYGFSTAMSIKGNSINPVTQNTIENNNFQTFVNSSTANHSVKFHYVMNSTFTMNEILKSEFALNITDSNGNSINHNMVFNNSYGIFLERSDDNTISDNNISTNDFYGILGWQGSDNNYFLNNTIMENGFHGLTLSENDIIGTSGVKQTCQDNILESNEIQNNSGHGIYLRGCNRTDVIENHISFSSENGINIYMSNNNLVVDNLFLNNTAYGIEYHFSTSTISDNNVCGNDIGDFYIDSILQNSGENNTCDNPNLWNDTGFGNCTTSCYLGPKCSDNTPMDHCSTIKPLFCDSGELIYDCTICGCSEGRICSIETGGCMAPEPVLDECQDGTLYGECSTNKPLFCDNGELANDCGSCGCSDSHECNVTTNFCGPYCDEGTPYEHCSSQLPSFCSNGTVIDLCGSCGCGNGTYCDYTDNDCEIKKSDESYCEANIECESDNCFHNKCRPSYHLCDFDVDCSDIEYCSDGLCYPKNSDGGNCTTDNRCLSGHCVDNNCIECFETNECGADQRCDEFVCVPIGITLSLSENINIPLGIFLTIIVSIVMVFFVRFTKGKVN